MQTNVVRYSQTINKRVAVVDGFPIVLAYTKSSVLTKSHVLGIPNLDLAPPLTDDPCVSLPVHRSTFR